jgi:Fe-S-cluster-containing dehydrogenase component
MAKKLYIDMHQCDQCEECTVTCSYMYQPDISDHGIRHLREQVAYQLVCRRCEEPSCVSACRFDALERQESGVLQRHTMRCMSCSSCSQACPFGTIYPELTPLYSARCDYCMSSSDGSAPACVASCEKNAIEWREAEESPDEGIYALSDHVVVKAPKWEKKDV